MTTVSNNSSGLSADILAKLNGTSTTTSTSSGSTTGTKNQALDQDAFLKLLITQLKNQNPLSPQDNTEFVSQLAQFSSLEGISNLNDTVTSLASGMQSSQALQASALVGRTVEVETDKAYLYSDGLVRGTIALPESTADLSLNVYDSNDNLVLHKDFGQQEAGDLPFAWDGTNNDGTKVDAGTYRFEVKAAGTDKSITVPTYLGLNVNSVTMGANQSMTLNVDLKGQIPLSDVKNIL